MKDLILFIFISIAITLFIDGCIRFYMWLGV